MATSRTEAWRAGLPFRFTRSEPAWAKAVSLYLARAVLAACSLPRAGAITGKAPPHPDTCPLSLPGPVRGSSSFPSPE